MDRITEVRRSSSPNSKYLEYGYDKLGQLVSVADHAAGLEYTDSFDTAGNILSAVKHPTGGGSDSTRTYYHAKHIAKKLNPQNGIMYGE